MQPMKNSVAHRMVLVASAVAVAAVAVTGSPALAAPSETQARAIWRDLIHDNPATAQGCYRAMYPSTTWTKTDCYPTPRRYMSAPRRSSTGQLETVGDGDDYAIKAVGTISKTVGSFPSVTGVRTERGVGVPDFGNGGILGPNEYTLQINSQMDLTTAACKSHPGCTIWQQYVYAPDYDVQGSASAFIEYWLIGYGTKCPAGWNSFAPNDCWKNSDYVRAPDEPITALANEKLSGMAKAGGNDTIVFTAGGTAYTFNARDNVLDLATAWDESEFNIVGNAGGSKAQFNPGSSVTVKVAVTDGTTAMPTCVTNAGTTGETNNLTLQACAAKGGASPFIKFTESN